MVGRVKNVGQRFAPCGVFVLQQILAHGDAAARFRIGVLPLYADDVLDKLPGLRYIDNLAVNGIAAAPAAYGIGGAELRQSRGAEVGDAVVLVTISPATARD